MDILTGLFGGIVYNAMRVKWTKEYKKAYTKVWRERNKERIKKHMKEWKEKNPNYFKDYSRSWREENPEYIKKYQERNKESIREYRKKSWSQLSECQKEKQRKLQRKYSKSEKYNKQKRKSRAKRRKDPRFRLDSNVASYICTSLHGKKGGVKWEKLVGYSIQDLIQRLEKQFDDKMSWGNYGTYWHVDHIRPVSSFNYILPSDSEFKECWALGNLQPLEAIENIKKSNKIKVTMQDPTN